MARFMPGARISQAHGTLRPADPVTGVRHGLVFAMYHPAAALRTPAIERTSREDMAAVPAALLDARRRRAEHESAAPPTPSAPPPGTAAPVAEPTVVGPAEPAVAVAVAVVAAETALAVAVAEGDDPTDQLSLF
jgi:hypothetical protein